MKNNRSYDLTGTQLIFIGIILLLILIGANIGFSSSYALAAASVASIALIGCFRLRAITIQTSLLSIVVMILWIVAGILLFVRIPKQQAEALSYCSVVGIALSVGAYIAMRVRGVQGLQRSAYWIVALLASIIPGIVRQVILKG